MTSKEFNVDFGQDDPKRLDLQQQVLIEGFGGALCCKVKEAAKHGHIKTVLDLSTGTGKWSELALAELQSLSPAGTSISIVATDVSHFDSWKDISSKSNGKITFVKEIDILDHSSLASLKEKHSGGKGFDLVHFTQVATFLPADKWESFVDAAVSLVAAEGWLQHESFDLHSSTHTLQGPLATVYRDYVIPLISGTGKHIDSAREFRQWCISRGMDPVDSHLVTLFGRHSGKAAGGKDPAHCEHVTKLHHEAVHLLTEKWLEVGAPRRGIEPAEAKKTIEQLRESLDPDKHEFDDRGFARLTIAKKTTLVKDIF